MTTNLRFKMIKKALVCWIAGGHYKGITTQCDDDDDYSLKYFWVMNEKSMFVMLQTYTSRSKDVRIMPAITINTVPLKNEMVWA